MEKRKIVLSIKEIEGCVENIELWCRFVRGALASYDVGTNTSIMYQVVDVAAVPPRTGGNCPPPPEDSWESGGSGGKKPVRGSRYVGKPKTPKSPKVRKKK